MVLLYSSYAWAHKLIYYSMSSDLQGMAEEIPISTYEYPY